MKKFHSFLILFFTVNLGFCQEATLRILGNSQYSDLAENKVLLLNFENNPEVCNPITQNKSIEIQVNEFNQNLKAEKIPYRLVHKETLKFNPERSKSYELLLPLDSNDYKIQKVINSSGIKLVKTYYKFSENDFENEDKKAIMAFKNSQEKAIGIAKNLKYKIVEIVSVDDDTSDANTIYELLGITDLDDERKEIMVSFFEQLNEIESNTTPTKEGAYSLWVTYRIKAL